MTIVKKQTTTEAKVSATTSTIVPTKPNKTVVALPPEPVITTAVFTSNTTAPPETTLVPDSIGAVAIKSSDPNSPIISNILEVTKWQSGNMLNALMLMDLSSIPSNATVTSASLRLTTTTPSSNGDATYMVGVYRVKKQFDPTAATWTNADTDPLIPWQNVGAMGMDDIEYTAETVVGIGQPPGIEYTFDITSLTQSWVAGTFPNYGILLERQDVFEHAIPNVYIGESRTFVSPTGADGARPSLTVTYQT